MSNIVRRDIFEDLFNWPRGLLRRDLIGALGPDGSLAVEWNPRCDVTEQDGEVLVHAELPGVKVEDMDVSIREGVLTIKGEKRSEVERDEEGRKYAERFFGSFERSVSIPKNVDEEQIKATLKDGVLEVRIPKTAPVQPEAKKVEITQT